MTYTELCAAMQDTCEDEFTAGQLATLVKQAEQKLYAAVQLPSLRKTATGALVNGTMYMDAPTDFLSVHSFAVVIAATGAYSFLSDKDVSFIREAYPVPTVKGTPKYYALYGPATDPNELKFILGPTPDANYATDLQYNHLPESIVTAGDTWLGENFDTALFNGALVEAIRFQKGDADMVKLYGDMYKDAVALLKNLADGKQRTDTYRTVQTRVKPQ